MSRLKKFALPILIGMIVVALHQTLLASQEDDYTEHREQSYGGSKCTQDYWVQVTYEFDGQNWYMTSYFATPMGDPYDCREM